MKRFRKYISVLLTIVIVLNSAMLSLADEVGEPEETQDEAVQEETIAEEPDVTPTEEVEPETSDEQTATPSDSVNEEDHKTDSNVPNEVESSSSNEDKIVQEIEEKVDTKIYNGIATYEVRTDSDFKTALQNATDGTTIKLTNNIVFESVSNIWNTHSNPTVTIDLNGYCLSGSAPYGQYTVIDTNCTIIIMDSRGGGSIINNTQYYGICIQAEKTILHSGSLQSASTPITGKYELANGSDFTTQTNTNWVFKHYNAVVWNWAENHLSATATVEDERLEGGSTTVVADVSFTKSNNSITFTAMIEYNGREYSDSVTIEMQGDYVVDWQWSNDYSAASITLTDPVIDEVVVDAVQVTSNEVRTGTRTVYSVNFEYDGVEYSCSKTFDYTLTWSWAADYSSATARFSCSELHDTKSVLAVMSTIDAEDKGLVATVEFNGVKYKSYQYSRKVVSTPDEFKFYFNNGIDGRTIVLKYAIDLSNLSSRIENDSSDSVIVDLNGSVLSGSDSWTLLRKDSGSLTIMDTVGGGSIYNYGYGSCCSGRIVMYSGCLRTQGNRKPVDGSYSLSKGSYVESSSNQELIIKHERFGIVWNWSDNYLATATIEDFDLALDSITVDADVVCSREGSLLVFTASVEYEGQIFKDTKSIESEDGYVANWSWSDNYRTAFITIKDPMTDEVLVDSYEIEALITRTGIHSEYNVSYVYSGTEYTDKREFDYTYSWQWTDDSATAVFKCSELNDTQRINADVEVTNDDNGISVRATAVFYGSEFKSEHTYELTWRWSHNDAKVEAVFNSTDSDDVICIEGTITSNKIDSIHSTLSARVYFFDLLFETSKEGLGQVVTESSRDYYFEWYSTQEGSSAELHIDGNIIPATVSSEVRDGNRLYYIAEAEYLGYVFREENSSIRLKTTLYVNPQKAYLEGYFSTFEEAVVAALQASDACGIVLESNATISNRINLSRINVKNKYIYVHLDTYLLDARSTLFESYYSNDKITFNIFANDKINEGHGGCLYFSSSGYDLFCNSSDSNINVILTSCYFYDYGRDYGCLNMHNVEIAKGSNLEMFTPLNGRVKEAGTCDQSVLYNNIISTTAPSDAIAMTAEQFVSAYSYSESNSGFMPEGNYRIFDVKPNMGTTRFGAGNTHVPAVIFLDGSKHYNIYLASNYIFDHVVFVVLNANSYNKVNFVLEDGVTIYARSLPPRISGFISVSAKGNTPSDAMTYLMEQNRLIGGVIVTENYITLRNHNAKPYINIYGVGNNTVYLVNKGDGSGCVMEANIILCNSGKIVVGHSNVRYFGSMKANEIEYNEVYNSTIVNVDAPDSNFRDWEFSNGVLTIYRWDSTLLSDELINHQDEVQINPDGSYYYLHGGQPKPINYNELKKLVIKAPIERIDAGVFRDCYNLTSVDFSGAEFSFRDDYDYRIMDRFQSAFSGTNIVDLTVNTTFFPGLLHDYSGTSSGQSSVAWLKKVNHLKVVSDKWPKDSLNDPWFYTNYTRNLSDHVDVVLGEGFSHIACDTDLSVDNIYSIKLPQSLKIIDDCAFYGQTYLNSVIIPKNVSYIGSSAFNGSGVRSIVYTNNSGYASYLGISVFANCPNLTSCTLPDDLSAIPRGTFMNCTSLQDYTLQTSVNSIGDFAFKGCTSLSSIVIPEGVTISPEAFADCTNLTSLELYCHNWHPNILQSAFSNTNIHDFTLDLESLYELSQYGNSNVTAFSNVDTVTVLAPSLGFRYAAFGKNNCLCFFSDSVDIELAEGIIRIPDNMFYGATNFDSIVLPDSIETIGDHAFYGCTELSSIILPDNVVTIGDYSFAGCNGISSVEISDNITAIPEGAFKDCTSLESLDIPDSVDTIGKYAFENCSNLNDIRLPVGLTVIPEAAFKGCSSLGTIDIPDGVVSIGDSVFEGCTSLSGIDLPDGITEIPICAFRNCSSLETIGIPAETVAMNVYSFEGCSNLTVVALPVGIDSIPVGAFKDCTSLREITAPGVKNILSSAFYNCTELEECIFDDKLESIGDNAFDNTALINISLERDIAIGDYAFNNVDGLIINYYGSPSEWTSATQNKHVYEDSAVIKFFYCKTFIAEPYLLNTDEVSIRLRWTLSDVDCDGYYLYVAPSSNVSQKTLLATLSNISSGYIFTTVPGEYRFWICPYDDSHVGPENISSVEILELDQYEAIRNDVLYSSFERANVGASVNDVVKLLKDINRQVTINTKLNTIDLNGHKIRIDGENTSAMNIVNSSVRIINTSDSESSIINAYYSYGYYGIYSENSDLTIENIKVFGNEGIYVYRGNLTVKGENNEIGGRETAIKVDNYYYNGSTRKNVKVENTTINNDIRIYYSGNVILKNCSLTGESSSISDSNNVSVLDSTISGYLHISYQGTSSTSFGTVAFKGVEYEGSDEICLLGNLHADISDSSFDVEYDAISVECNSNKCSLSLKNCDINSQYGSGLNAQGLEKIEITDTSIVAGDCAIRNFGDATIVVNSGEFSGDYALDIYKDPNSAGRLYEGSITVVDGMFEGRLLNNMNRDDAVVIKGGLFSRFVDQKNLFHGCFCNSNEDAATKDKYPYIVERQIRTFHNLSLEGDIGVNFFYAIDPAMLSQGSNVTVKFSCDDKEYSAPVIYTDDRYKASFALSSSDMTKEITAYTYIDGELVDTHTYSVRQYANIVLDNPEKYNPDLVTLMKAMMNYGGYAQLYFGSDEPIAFGDEPYQLDIDTDDLKGVAFNKAALNEYLSPFGLSYYGASLELESTTMLKLNFTITDAALFNSSAVEFYINGQKVRYTYISDDMIRISTVGICANELGDIFHFGINDYEFDYSPMNYLYNASRSSKESLRNLAVSLYIYNKAAIKYLDR